jgi:heptosyltransferase I
MPRRASDFERFLDRFLGIPLLAALGARPKRPLPPAASVARIGVLKTGSIGDTLLLAGSFDALRAAYPAARIILITTRENGGAAPLFGPVIDEHIEISVRSPANAVRALRSQHLDIMIECGPWPRIDALLAALSGARYTIGFRVPGQARHYALDRSVDHSSRVHQLENFRQLFRAAGVREFAPPRVARPNVLPPDRIPPRPFAVLHPWSGGYMGWVKQWPADRWIELARRLHDERGMSILLSGGPRDAGASAELAASMRATGTPAVSGSGQYSLAELADVLCEAAITISVNTGTMHLAALLGAPTVSLEGPVPVARWGPLGPRVRSVESTLPGCGYLDLGFEYAGRRLDCMEGVTVDAVMGAVDALTGLP